MEQQELLNQSYQQLKQTLSSNGNFKINRKIGYKSRRLKYEYGLEDDEIFSAIFCEFLSKKLYEKITPEKALSTFITHTTNYMLSTLIREQQRGKTKLSKNFTGRSG